MDWKGFAARWLTAAAWVYFTILFGWLASWLLVGDRIGYLGLFNAFGPWYFVPLPLTAIMAAALQRKSLGIGTLLGLLAFLALFGKLFLPKATPPVDPQATLTIMTYNTLGVQYRTEPIIAVLGAENPDVVFLQEVNPGLAEAIQSQLSKQYPYRILDPQQGVRGMGVISKFPLRASEKTLPLEWVGRPQVLEMEWNGQTITLVNFHTWPTGLGPPWAVTTNFRQREEQAQALADFAANTPGPLIVAGDANATPLNDAYRIITNQLKDAWIEAGFGFGHTFPGSSGPGSARPRLLGVPFPQWMARIDYVFVSKEWVALRARVAKFDGVSDHRGVIVALTLSP